MVEEDPPAPHWPGGLLLQLLAVLLLGLCGALAVLGLANAAQFAVLATNNWWTAVFFAAPLLTVPFVIKYVLAQIPPGTRRIVYPLLIAIGLLSIGAFVWSFADRFGKTTPCNSTDLGSFLGASEDHRLQLISQILLELSCGTALLLWLRSLLVGPPEMVANSIRDWFIRQRREKKKEIDPLEETRADAQGDLDTVDAQRQVAILEGLAQWRALHEAMAARDRLHQQF